MAYDKITGSVMNLFFSLGNRINDYRSNRTKKVVFTNEDHSQHQSEKKRMKK